MIEMVMNFFGRGKKRFSNVERRAEAVVWNN
jgi:hypothetical protein